MSAYTLAETLGAIARVGETELVLRAAPAADGSGNILLLVHKPPEPGHDITAEAVHVYILGTDAQRLRLVASGRLAVPVGACVNLNPAPDMPGWNAQIDPTPYVVSPDRPAFSVVVTCTISQPSSDGEENHRFLLQQAGDTVVRLLSFRSESGVLDRVGRIDAFAQTTLTVLSREHDGYFDLSLRTRRERKIAPLGDGPEKILGVKTSTRIYRWSGRGYQPANVAGK